MKKILLSTLIVISLFFMTGCKKEENSVTKVEYKNLSEALEGYYEQINNSTEQNEKEKLLTELEEYVLKDFQGFYYYHENNTYSCSDYVRKHYPYRCADEIDQRVVHMKSKDEVYIYPFLNSLTSEEEIKATNLDDIENKNEYKYKILEVTTREQDCAYNASKSATIVLQNYDMIEKYGDTVDEDFTTVEIFYCSDDNSYAISGYFADMIVDGEDLTKNTGNIKATGMSGYREYYRDFETAEKKNQSEVEEDIGKANKENEIKNSIPKVGMTSDEVKRTKWGYPDKVNKDTYSWGTSEQWVYNDYGYVYLKNGVVTSVSER